MAKFLLHGLGGLVFENPGDPFHIEPGTTTTTPTTSSCSNGWPEMVLSVFDADYVGGNITWCGLVWTQAMVQSGETQILCPTSYQNAPVGITNTTQTCQAGHRQNWTATGLKMYAAWRPPRIVGGGAGYGEYRHILSVYSIGNAPIGLYGSRAALFQTGSGSLPTGCLGTPNLGGAGTGVLTLFAGDAFGLGLSYAINTNIANTNATQCGFGVSGYVNGYINPILNYGRITDNGIQFTWRPGNGW